MSLTLNCDALCVRMANSRIAAVRMSRLRQRHVSEQGLADWQKNESEFHWMST
jgi:hypothetical protein